MLVQPLVWLSDPSDSENHQPSQSIAPKLCYEHGINRARARNLW